MLNASDLAERIAHELTADNIDAGRYFPRHQRKGVIESVVPAKPLKQHENQNIDCDKSVIDYRRSRPVGIIITDWKHFLKPSLFLNLQPNILSTSRLKFGNTSD
jgi:hypothetical protein